MNTNPKAKRILCYGDSYIWGYQPLTNHLRYDAETRWTGVLQSLLGSRHEVIEEGLNSRTLNSTDARPGKEGRNGYDYLIPCLDTHDPLDLVILMLGTNELKETYNKNAKEIAALLVNEYVITISSRKSQFLDNYPQVLVIAPPIVNENTEYGMKRGYSTQKSEDLVNYLIEMSDNEVYYFINSNDFVSVGDDGVHFDNQSHKRLAEGIYNFIKNKIFQD